MSFIRLFGRIFYYVTLVLKQEITIKTMCSNSNLETPKISFIVKLWVKKDIVIEHHVC